MSGYVGPNNSLNYSVKQSNINGLIISNLELYYDLNRSYSYSGSGAILKDLSGNGRDATMYNAGGVTYSINPPGAPTFSNNRSGEFIFDGIDFGKFPQITAGTNFTASIWCKTTNANRENGIISHCNGGPVGLGYGIYQNKMLYKYYDTTWRNILSTISVNDGTWKNLVWAKSGTNLILYINNVLDSTHILNSDVNSRALVSFGCLWGPCSSDSYGPGSDSYGSAFIGSISSVMLHSKQLSFAEVSQNFNATRNRYGI